MTGSRGVSRRRLGRRTLGRAAALAVFVLFGTVSAASARQAGQVGSVGGTVTSDVGAPVVGAEVVIQEIGRSTLTRASGEYLLDNVAPGRHTVEVRMIGFRTQVGEVTVMAGQRASLNFTMAADPLKLDAVVVTGTQAPRQKLEASVAVTILAPEDLEKASPRSTTEMLRYVPGFTRVESSGGEVNQNISMRGILGVEYVMFMEDGLPVFPTMHTFFMNADNLFRPDDNIQRMEVVRGGASALFGSNTPGAIINFINRTGGAEVGGSLKATAGTGGLARYDFNVNGPMGDDWRFNVGGFYRYDHGVRDPGFPGIRGGQLKASVTRLLERGHIRTSLKVIDDRNQFILPLPFRNPDDPEYVEGFSNYGAMTTPEGNRIRVPTPDGELELPLDDGLRTEAYWLTADFGFDLPNGWRLQNSAQIMENQQGWNAIVPFNAVNAESWAQGVITGQLGLPAGTPYDLFYTNHFDADGSRQAFGSANGLIAPSGEWHVEKPLSAFQDQLQLRKAFGDHSLAVGVYFANYSQTNRWYFTDILMDVRDNPRFVDLVVYDGADTIEVSKNGFTRYLSNYVNGSGQATVFSGMLGGELALSDRLRADVGIRYEFNDFVQSSENTSQVDLDGDPDTPYDLVPWGNGSFRHFSRSLGDWAGSIGLNYTVNDQVSVYAQGSRAYKMPALDEFLNAAAVEQIELFEARQTLSGEMGVKLANERFSATVNGFYTLLKNIVGQGAVVDENGNTVWQINTDPENRSYGLELEVSTELAEGLQLLGNGTILKAEVGSGADIGSWLNGVPPFIGNLAATYAASDVSMTADLHYVGRRYANFTDGIELNPYTYANFAVGYDLPVPGMSLNAALLNVFQSTGFEEGNPRLTTGTGSGAFLARPLLPRRLTVALRYDF